MAETAAGGWGRNAWRSAANPRPQASTSAASSRGSGAASASTSAKDSATESATALSLPLVRRRPLAARGRLWGGRGRRPVVAGFAATFLDQMDRLDGDAALD